MRSRPIAATALLSLALILPSCGDERTATVGSGKEHTSAAGIKAIAPAGSRVAVKRCRGELGDFLESIESLGNTLAVGLDYEQYLDSVNRVRASYASVVADRLGIVCLGRVAAPAEDALNIYIGSANQWGNCLASASCDPDSIEPKLQREWERASDQLARARRGLRNLS